MQKKLGAMQKLARFRQRAMFWPPKGGRQVRVHTTPQTRTQPPATGTASGGSMSTNDEMARIMTQEGLSGDRQRFLRGGGSSNQAKYWLAVKESQNLVLADDKSFVLWMNSKDRNVHTQRWKVSPAGSSRLTVWMKRSKKNPRKLWTRLGVYTFGEIIQENHCVTKRGKPHNTDIARVATPVVD